MPLPWEEFGGTTTVEEDGPWKEFQPSAPSEPWKEFESLAPAAEDAPTLRVRGGDAPRPGLIPPNSMGTGSQPASFPALPADDIAIAQRAAAEGKPVVMVDGRPTIGEAPQSAPLSSGDQIVQGIERGLGGAALRVAEGVTRLVGASGTADALGKDVAAMDSVLPQQTTAGKVGSGVGGALALMSGGGLPGALGIAGTQAVAGGYDAAYAKAKEEGKSEEMARNDAKGGAFKSVLRTVPELAAYWLLGLGAAKIAEPLVKGAGPIVKTAVSGTAATAANVGTSTTLRAIHGEPLFTAEGLATDATFGFLAHGLTVGKQAVGNEAQVREMLKSTPLESLKAAAEDPAFRKSSPYRPELIDAEIASRTSNAGAEAVATPPIKALAPDATAPAPSPEQPPSAETRSQTPVPAQTTAEGAPVPEAAKGGPGAMGPVEAAEMAAANRTTGVKNAQVEAERIMRGEEPMTKEEPLPNRQAIAEAVQAIEKDPSRPDVIIEGINSSTRDARSISVADQAVLMAHKVDLIRRRAEQESIYGDGNRTPEEHAVAAQKLTEIEQRMNQVDQATEAMGTEGGRFLQLRQRLLRQDYSLEAMERRARIQKGDVLTPEESLKIKEQADKIENLGKELEAKESAKADEVVDAEVTRTVEATKQEVGKQTKADPETGQKFDPRILQIAERIVGGLEKQGNEALERIRKRRAEGRLNALPVEDLVDYAIYGASKIARSGLDFTRWSAEMVKDIGEMTKEELDEVWKASNAKIDEIGNAKVVSAIRAKKKGEPTTAGAKASAKAESVAGDELSHKTVYEYVRALINEGVHGEGPLMKSAHEGLKEFYPKLTERDVRRAYSEYGKVKFPSKEAVAVEMSELRTLTRLQESIDRLTEGRDAMKTGLQRDNATQEIRDKTKQLNELLRKLDGPPSPEKLASREEAKQTALRNAIDDLDRQLRTGEKPPGRTPAEDSVATAQLRAERDAMRAKLQEIQEAAKEVPNPAEVQVQKLEKALSDLSDRMSGKKEATPPKEWEALSKRAEDLQAEIQAMRQLAAEQKRAEAPRKSAEAKQLEELSRTKEKLDDVLSGKRPASAPKDWTPLTAAAADMKAEILAMQELAAQMRRDAKPKADPGAAKETAQIKALEEAISRYEAKIAARDFSTKGKVQGPDSARVAELKEIRDARIDAYNAAKKAGKPVRTKDEIALQSYKTRTANRIAELNEKIAKGDFAKAPKRELALDKPALDLKVKIEQVKEQYNKALVDFKMSNRTLPERLIGAAAETSNLQRAIFTGLDLSAILNQGGFIVLGAPFHPIRTFHALKAMVQGMKSGEGKIGVMENIKQRSNYPLYEKAKLYLSNSKTGSLHAAEEAFMSRWLDKMELSTQQGLKGTALRTMQRSVNTLLAPVRASERAYTTFLNQLRVETFDRMKASFESKNGPVDIAQARVIADFVNTATGRGGFGKFEPTGVALSTVFFSPRFVISRLGLLTGEPLWRGNAATRQLIAKEYGKYAVGVATFYALGIAGGGEIETDPRSSDFGKLRFGNIRIDPLVGMAQLLVFMSRTVTGETKDSQGRIIPLRGHDRPLDWLRKQGWLDDKPEPFNAKNPMQKKWLKVLTSFVRSKAAPVPGAVVGGLAGEDFAGQETSILSELSKIIAPMSSQAIYKTMKENGLTAGVALTIAQILGARVSQYEDRFDREAHK